MDSLENLRVLEGSEVFFRGLQHLYPRFKSGWHLYKIQNSVFWIFFIKKLYANVLVLDSVAIVDSVVDKKGTREVATEYLNYLYSDEAQRIAGDNYYRPSNEDILKEYADVFDLNVNLVTIDDFGGWEKAQETHFADGGVFDQIYEE